MLIGARGAIQGQLSHGGRQARYTKPATEEERHERRHVPEGAPQPCVSMDRVGREDS